MTVTADQIREVEALALRNVATVEAAIADGGMAWASLRAATDRRDDADAWWAYLAIRLLQVALDGRVAE